VVVVEYLLVGLAGYALLCFLGWPLWTVVVPENCPVSLALGAPVVGLALLQTFAWYWLDNSGHGWSTGFPILLGLNAVAFIVCMIRRRPKIIFDRRCAITVVLFVGLVAATCALFTSNYQVVATHGDAITAGSLGNNDIAAYAITTKFVHDDPLSSSGPISRWDLGAFTRKDVFGVFPVVDSTATVTGVGDWQALLPVVLTMVLLSALAVRDLANRLFPGSRMRATIVAVIASAGYLFALIQGHYFISQLMAMPIAVGLAVIYLGAVDQTTRANFFRLIALVALFDIVLAFTYAHMLFLSQPIIGGAVLLAIVGKGWAAKARRVVTVAALGMVATAVVIPQRFWIALHTLADLVSDKKSGFPLNGFTPLQVLGLQKTLTAPSHGQLLLQGAVVLLVVALAAAVLWRTDRRGAAFCVAAPALILGSYYVIFFSRGRSYTQWKWISFFQPLYMGTVILVVCAALAVLLQRVNVRTTLRLVGGGLAGVIVLYVVLHDTRQLTARRDFWTKVPPQLAAIHDSPRLAKIDTLNVKLAPYWESMWGTYFLEPRTVYLRSKTYYPKSGPVATWTLEPAADPDPANEVAQPLNPAYKIVRAAPGG
jgi:hypothetical protein